MNCKDLLERFKSQLLTLTSVIPNMTENEIALPNSRFDKSGKVFWIELSIESQEEKCHTEEEGVSRFLVVYRICVPRNTGITPLMNASAKISKLWSSGSSGTSGFTLNGADIFIRKVEQRSVAPSENVYCMEVQVTADCFNQLP